MSSKMNTQVRLVRCPRCRNVLPERPDVPLYECGGCGAVLQAKKRRPDTVDTTSRILEEDSSGKRKMEQVSDDQNPGSSTTHSINEPDRKSSDRNSVHISSELSGLDQEAAKKSENCKVDAQPDGVKEYSSGKQKMEQLPDVQEACSSSNQQSLVSSMDEPDRNNDRNDPRSSTELSGHGDPESSPEAASHRKNQHQAKEQDQVQEQDATETRSNSPESAVHGRINQDREHGMLLTNGVMENFKNEVKFEESSRELTASPEKSSYSELNEEPSRKAIANTKIVRDSDRGSNSSFKSLIAEKLLDTRQKKVVYMDEDDILSEDGGADLFHRRRFDRISSEETLDNARFGGTSYEYEGSVSSFDGNNDNQFPTKKHVDSGNEYHPKHRREFHPPKPKGRRSKDEHRSTEFRPFYGNEIPSRLRFNEFHENPRHLPPLIPGNAKMERLELLKMVRELQDQLERTNVSNTAPQIPSYYDHGLPHPGRYGQRMAFSGEAVPGNRRLDDDSGMCHRCYPQDRHHFSAQLPRQHVCCHGSHYVPSTCYSPESDFSAPVRVKPEPDNHRHRIRIDVPKPYNSSSPKKRYVRPISGGSPWVNCYRCSEVLQLPQSFLVFKKRCHSLRCGACQKVLNFTVSDGTHVHRYYPEESIAAPPSSEVEDYGNSRVDSVSCSDISFQKSYSTETDRNGSREFGEERRKAIMFRGPSGSTGPSSSSKTWGRRKVTSEIEEVEPAYNGSPLHWLMGYASPSKVIRG